jgi:hypothetical protein
MKKEILEIPIISFLPNTPKKACRYHLPNRSTPRPFRCPPTSKQVNGSPRHNPRQTKMHKESTLQSVSHIAVKKKMILRFPISLAHATSIHQNNMPLPEIIHCKDLTYSRRPLKISCPRRNLSLLHTLPRKMNPYRASQRAKERSDLEHAFFGGDPPQPIFTTSSYID